MEIFLLLVVITLIIVYQFKNKSKINLLQTKLDEFNLRIKLLQQRLEEKNTTVTNVSNQEKEITKQVIEEIKPVEKEQPIIAEEKIIEKTEHTSFAEIKTEQQQQQLTNTIAPIKKENWFTNFKKNNPDLEKFVGENLASKIGIGVLVLGIAFFVKLAIDENWINEIARVGIGLLCGGILIVLAHKLQKKYKTFSSILIAGGVSVFYFTIGIAFHEYHIFSQTVAFLIMIVITLFAVFTSILYNKIELAALSLIGGFATPIMLSTGGGNYKILFSYILILDVGMLVLAYFRKWHLINILSYLFTIIIYVGWLKADCLSAPYPPYKGALFFGMIFYVLFIIMNLINNLIKKLPFKAIDFSILLANSFVFYISGMLILNSYHAEWKGVYTIIMALINLTCAFVIFKLNGADKKLLYLLFGLTLTFVTLAIPVQLNGNYITLFWALEALLLLYLAQKSSIVIFRFASFIITTLMLFSLFMDWIQVYSGNNYNYEPYKPESLKIILNKAFITGIISSVSFIISSLLIKNETEKLKYLGIVFNPKGYRIYLKISAVCLLYLTGFLEVIHHSSNYFYSAYTTSIVTFSYHLIFFSLLNLLVKSNSSNPIKLINFILNYINIGLFALLFAWFPLAEIKVFTYNGIHSYIGFIMHYFSLACVAFMAFKMYKVRTESNTPIANMKILNSILLITCIVYLCSIELTLHTLKLSVQPLENVYDLNLNLTKKIEFDKIKILSHKVGYPILWGLIAFVTLFIGMKKQAKILRILALLLLGITLVKLFTFDISNVSKAGKIIAFVILGVLLLIISFMYQKIKNLLIDDKNEQTESKIEN